MKVAVAAAAAAASGEPPSPLPTTNFTCSMDSDESEPPLTAFSQSSPTSRQDHEDAFDGAERGVDIPNRSCVDLLCRDHTARDVPLRARTSSQFALCFPHLHLHHSWSSVSLVLARDHDCIPQQLASSENADVHVIMVP